MLLNKVLQLENIILITNTTNQIFIKCKPLSSNMKTELCVLYKIDIDYIHTEAPQVENNND